jgi:hypothetical protein
MTLAGFLAYEIAYYIDRYLMHKAPVLWEFHTTHHTAEVLTPLTAFRVHPMDTLIFVNITAIAASVYLNNRDRSTGRPVKFFWPQRDIRPLPRPAPGEGAEPGRRGDRASGDFHATFWTGRVSNTGQICHLSWGIVV